VLGIGRGQEIFWPVGQIGKSANGQWPKLAAKALLGIGHGQVKFWPVWPLAIGQIGQIGQDLQIFFFNYNLFF
jgi:hypothetical protein